MTFNLYPCDIVLFGKRDELLPQILIFDRFFGRRPPSVLLPLGEPALRKGALKIRAVSVEPNVARHFERAETLDGGLKLHSIVGRQRRASAEHEFMPAELEKRCPASRARITAAGAVCVNRDFFHVGRMRIM